jgi:hypothetical protein
MVDSVKSPLYNPSPRILAILNTVIPQLAPEMRAVDRKPVQLRHLLVLELRGGKVWEDTCGDAFEHTR